MWGIRKRGVAGDINLKSETNRMLEIQMTLVDRAVDM